jgi:hypothetical protein
MRRGFSTWRKNRQDGGNKIHKNLDKSPRSCSGVGMDIAFSTRKSHLPSNAFPGKSAPLALLTLTQRTGREQKTKREDA